jgi:hypothetical protein
VDSSAEFCPPAGSILSKLSIVKREYQVRFVQYAQTLWGEFWRNTENLRIKKFGTAQNMQNFVRKGEKGGYNFVIIDFRRKKSQYVAIFVR